MTKYYCDKCAKAKEFPKKFRKVFHVCDGCAEAKLCNDDKPVKEWKK